MYLKQGILSDLQSRVKEVINDWTAILLFSYLQTCWFVVLKHNEKKTRYLNICVEGKALLSYVIFTPLLISSKS